MLNKKVKDYFTIGSVGLHLVSGIIVGLAIGYFLDKTFNTNYTFTIIFFFLGILTGFYNMYKDVMKYVNSGDKRSD
jgi:ATP synthase protein I